MKYAATLFGEQQYSFHLHRTASGAVQVIRWLFVDSPAHAPDCSSGLSGK